MVVVKSITYPKMNEDLAEFIGICFGDGHLNFEKKRYTYRLSICGHLINDKDYIENYVTNLAKKLFNHKPVLLYVNKINMLDSYILSKKLIYFINSYGMPIGKKTNLKFPKKIKKNQHKLAFTRGLFDTDGSLGFRNNYPILSITSINKELLEDVNILLNHNGINTGKVVENKRTLKGYDKIYVIYKLFINGKKNLLKWKSIIGFSNSKHLNKYNNWIRFNNIQSINLISGCSSMVEHVAVVF